MALFKRRAEYASQTVREKIITLDGEIAAAQRQLQDAALAGALDDTDTRADAASAEIARLRQRREVLVAALAAAEQAERDEAAKQREAARQAMLRAVRQQVALIIKQAKAYETATADAVSAWRHMVEVGDKMRRLIPFNPKTEHFALACLPSNLRRFAEIELGRVGASEPLLEDDAMNAPGARWLGHALDPGVALVRQSAPLSERLEREMMAYWRQMAGETPPPVTAPAPRPEPTTSSEVVEPGEQGEPPIGDIDNSPEMQRLRAAIGNTVGFEPYPASRPGLVARDETGNPYPADSEQGRGYDVALAEIQRRQAPRSPVTEEAPANG